MNTTIAPEVTAVENNPGVESELDVQLSLT